MAKRQDINTILIIGAGPIVIGQACEFDYSGTQGIKALKEEGYRVVLINSNPATIMTDSTLADKVYIEPITPEFIEQIIVKEKIEAILPTLGGQTALNAALLLERLGILAKYSVKLIGVSIEAIKKAEDRGLFKEAMERIGLKCPASIIVSSFEHGFDNFLWNACFVILNNKILSDWFKNKISLGEETPLIAKVKELEGFSGLAQISFSEEERDVLELYLQNIEDNNFQFFVSEFERLKLKHENQYISLPLIIRPSLTLGGTGGGVAITLEEYLRLLKSGLEASPIGQIQVDKSIIGWKEFEMEVVRDRNDNCIIVCSIENIDPMGVHTGDSITVAPAITLTDKEYQKMRDYSIAVLREIGVETGGSNVQFAVNPKDGEIVIIEMNPRVSRSSALASKATGFPIAKIAAKLAVGYTLDELKNDVASIIPKHFNYITYKEAVSNYPNIKSFEIKEYIEDELAKGFTLFDLKQRALPASFEPVLDYIVVKIPKFNFEKFNTFKPELGTQMQSVGEVMAMGRNFEEAFLKAVSGMEEALEDLSKISIEGIISYLKGRFPKRIYYILEAFRRGLALEEIATLTSYDPWFLERLHKIILIEKEISGTQISADLRKELEYFISKPVTLQHEVKNDELFKKLSHFVTKQKVFKWKKLGFRDGKIRELLGIKAGLPGIHFFKEYRKFLGVIPVFKKIDSCAGEFLSNTNYFYSTYEESMNNEALPSNAKKIVILGSGPNRVGQGIEFDYSCVHAAFALKEMGIESIMINCNPETVSTDYDTSDRLFFEPLSEEHVMNVIENEASKGDLLGVIIQLGGQTPLKLRQTLKASGIKILGMEKDAIDVCDNRAKFSSLVKAVGAKEAESFEYSDASSLKEIAEKLQFQCIIRPSSVIGGRGMAIIQSSSALEYYIANEASISVGIINPLLQEATEFDIDLIRDKSGKIFIFGVLEHIEYVGVHSGDSSCTVQSRSISPETLEQMEKLACSFAQKLEVTGLINIQMAVKGEEVFIIEVNPRASRTVPFTAKALTFPFVNLAVKVMCGKLLEEEPIFLNFSFKEKKNEYYVLQKLPFVAVKEPVFSFEKFLKSDIIRGPEMKSLGEVMGIAKTFGLAYAKALIASGQKFASSGTAFISINNSDKSNRILHVSQSLLNLGFKLIATKGTATFLLENGVSCEVVNKVYEGGDHIVKRIDGKEVSLVINTPSNLKSLQDSFLIRRAIIRNKVLHSTTIEGGEAIINAITEYQKEKKLEIF